MVIRKENLTAYERWEIGSFDRPRPAVQPQDPAPPPPEMASEVLVEPSPPLSLPTAEEIERIHEEARSSGFTAGYEEGKAQGELAAQEEAEQLIASLTSVVANLRGALTDLDQGVAETLLKLSIEVASQITRSIVKTRADLLLPVIREAIAALPLHHGHIILSLHPQDALHVRPLLGEQFAQTGAQLLEDASVTPGGCLVRAGASEIDATIETRWMRVIEAIGATSREWLQD